MSLDIEKGYGNTAPYGDGNYKGEVGITYIADYLGRARNLLVEQFEGSSKFNEILDAFSNQVQEIEDVIFDLRMKRFLSIAEGEQLDGIGQIVGELRKGRNDVDYRVGLDFRIFVNKSYGQMSVVSNFLAKALGEDAVYLMNESFPASINIVIQAKGILDIPNNIFQKTDSIAAGGVKVHGYIQDISINGKILRCIEVLADGSGNLAVPLKPDTGSLTEGQVGSYPPSEVTAGTLVEYIATGA